jgi:hypothetical protein
MSVRIWPRLSAFCLLVLASPSLARAQPATTLSDLRLRDSLANEALIGALAGAQNSSAVPRETHLKLPTSAVIAAEARHMQQRSSRDSLKNGTLAGMIIGMLAGLIALPLAMECFGDNQGECDPGMVAVGAGIGAAIGAAIGMTVDALRSATPGGAPRFKTSVESTLGGSRSRP